MVRGQIAVIGVNAVRVVKRHRAGVPASVPKLGPRPINQQPTPTKLPMKNGPEIIDFKPVLESRATLANRRLQPLGHLTSRLGLVREPRLKASPVSIRRAMSCAKDIVHGRYLGRAGAAIRTPHTAASLYGDGRAHQICFTQFVDRAIGCHPIG